MSLEIDTWIDWLKLNSNPLECNQIENLELGHIYYKNNIKGSLDKMYLRKGVAIQLEKVCQEFKKLGFGVKLLDGFRTLESQETLFEYYFKEAKKTCITNEKSYELVSTYWTDPKKCNSSNEIAPHNSGGSIDITLTKDTKEVNMGSEFDEMSNKSSSDYFESNWHENSDYTIDQWNKFRDLRRLLRKVLLNHGFTNYKEEWWHFDLGTSFWALAKQSNWQYDSMEESVKAMQQSS